MKIKSVYVSGYFKGNFGDDIFLKLLIERYCTVRFYIIADKKKYDKFSRNLCVINCGNRIYNKLFNILKKKNVMLDELIENILAKLFSISIKIGGSLFMEDVVPLDSLKHQYKNKRYYIIGANVGPVFSEEYRKEIINIFNNSRDICLRDYSSFEEYSSICNKVRYAPDIAFQLRTNIEQNNDSTRSVMISVINPERVNKANNDEKPYYSFSKYEIEMYYDYIEGIVRDYHNQGYTVKMISLCSRDKDEKLIDNLSEKYDYIKKIVYCGDIQNVLDEFSRADCIFATRYHAMIIGFLMNKVTIPIVYSDKMLNVMNDMGYTNPYYDIRYPNKSIDIDLQNYKKVELNKAIEQSANHFALLDERLMNE